MQQDVSEHYKGYLVRAVSTKFGVKEKGNGDEWYPTVEVYKDGKRLIIEWTRPIRGTLERANEVALANGKSWIDKQI